MPVAGGGDAGGWLVSLAMGASRWREVTGSHRWTRYGVGTALPYTAADFG
ncbi:hypothetical protein OG979_34550 [Actinomadura citrea]|nr:hypothetical protein [Actinomadura citrea]